MRIQNGTPALENRLAVSYKAKDSLNIHYSNRAMRYLTNLFEKSCPHENQQTNAYTALFTITQNVKELRCLSIGKWKNKQWHIHAMDTVSDKKKRKKKE